MMGMPRAMQVSPVEQSRTVSPSVPIRSLPALPSGPVKQTIEGRPLSWGAATADLAARRATTATASLLNMVN